MRLDFTFIILQTAVSDSAVLVAGFPPSSIYDPVGMAVPSLKCIAWKGRVIIIGFAAGTIEKVRVTPFQFYADTILCTHSLPSHIFSLNSLYSYNQIPANLILLKK